jgi:hypothetical protein
VNQSSLSAFIWSVADLLRGNFTQSEYGCEIQGFSPAAHDIFAHFDHTTIDRLAKAAAGALA